MRALELGGPEEHVMGLIAMTLSSLGQPDRALPWYELTRRCALYPGNWDSLIGDCWSKLADDVKAEAAYRRACELQPDLPHGWIGIARLHLLRGEIEAARRICRERQAQYGQFLYSTEIAAMVEFFGRNYSEAERLYGQLARLDSNSGATFYGDVSATSALGYLRLTKRDSKRGQDLLRDALAKELSALKASPQSSEILYRIAAIESSLHESESAIAHLQAAAAAGWIDYRSLAVDPRFDPIANDIRFETLLGKLKLKVDDMRNTLPVDFPPEKTNKPSKES
jgi:tetratricopeptide (TPR) repeat protein